MTTAIIERAENKQAEALPIAEDTAMPSPARDAAPASPKPATPRERAAAFREAAMEMCVPAGLERDTEPYRRARLITGFGLLGFVFGAIYAAFYLLIGHVYGASIIIVCSLAVVCVPFILRASGSTRLAGNLLTLILLLGFGGLCAIEGGVRGHAIGWLAATPLCALLLVAGPEAAGWCIVSVAVTGFFVVLDLCGVRLPLLYPERWHQVVTGAGYLGLTGFMSVLGLIFEGGRRRAFARMERALERVSVVNARLKKLDAEKNEFLGVAAHDLKNPLSIVMGFAELIASGRNSASGRDRDDARYIIEAANRMIALITQLLDVNAIEQGKFPIEIGVCDLGAISRQVAESYATAAEKKQISLYAAGPLMPARVLADSKAAYRILDNLLSNAIKYSPPGRDVFVRIRNLPDAVVWEVQDQGAGLTEEDKARLFQRFTKLSARPTGGESSTGLGLSIVKMLAEQMNGTVECRSKAGEGATFALRLPLAMEMGASPSQTAGVAA
jgi:signal transduction histidine kinase